MRIIHITLFLTLALATYAQINRFPNVPGTVIAHRPASEKVFLGTPSICILPDGHYLVSHDLFSGGKNGLLVYESTDKGQSWKQISELEGTFTGLFMHRNQLYMIGVMPDTKNLTIRKSDDGGKTWTQPLDKKSGLIRQGDGEKGFHTSSMPVLIANGRIWRSVELAPVTGQWGRFEALVLSAPENANLLDASVWKTSSRMSVDTCWGQQYRTWLEGGAVLAPDGQVVNILRVDNRHEEMAAIQHVSSGGEQLSFCPERDFIRFPGGCKKFVIRYDSLSNKYWTLSNWIPEKYRGHNIERTRNTLALSSSPDLRTWTVHSVILQDDNIEKSGFQYADWLVEGDDIIFVSRTAFFDGTEYADNQHNSNFITFHRIPGFRKHAGKELDIFRN